MDKNLLVQFYINQYELACQKKQRNAKRPAGYDDRLVRFSKTLKKGRAQRMSIGLLEEFHKQAKNLAYFAYRSQNQKAIRRIQEEILPELFRLDSGLLMPEEQEQLDEEFLDYAREAMPLAIAFQSLYDIFRSYKQFTIKNKILDLVPSRPEMEFPDALQMQRHFILHIGPTNSGKTYHALERLKSARKGVYLGPLRLLALEVYEKMHEYGTPCMMLTGQECIEDENSRVTASTIEMAEINQFYDVAVIDEAQMVADGDRGHSWTRAILGLLAKEIHVCMSPAAEAAVLHLIGLCGDSYEIVRYERKTKLEIEKEPFIFPDSIREGDALIVFSKKSVLDVAGRLEAKGISASVIYGSLPPEIRRRQMELFISGQTKVVVATDAIGMGLNLPVERIVFIQTEKFDGTQRRPLTVPEVLQIAGRAGRYGLYETGYINAMGQNALDFIRERFGEEEMPVESVSLGFPQVLLDMDEPLDAILKIWSSVEATPPFEKVSIEDTLFLYEQAYKHKEKIDGFEDKHMLYRMISCPIDVKERQVVNQWLHYCETYTADKYLDFPLKGAINGPGILRNEIYYKELDLYYQFSQRMGKEIDERWLEIEREHTEAAIMRYLLKGKKHYIATCRYCGRQLPVGYTLGRCEKCRSRR